LTSFQEKAVPVSGQAESVACMWLLHAIAYASHLILAVICICAEETFAGASAVDKGFVASFSFALDFYMRSAVRVSVNKAIGVLLEGRDRLDIFLLEPLTDIVMNHRLRMWLFIDFLPSCSDGFDSVGINTDTA
jgi:hypothetical protein